MQTQEQAPRPAPPLRAGNGWVRPAAALGVAALNAAAPLAYQHPWSARAASSLWLSFVADALLWLLVISLLPRARAGAWLGAIVLAAPLVCAHLLCIGYFHDLHRLPPESALGFLHYPGYARTLFTERARAPWLLAALGAISLLSLLFYRASPRFTGARELHWLAPLAALGVAASTFAYSPNLTLDAYALHLIAKAPRGPLPVSQTWAPHRLALPDVAFKPRPNLLLFRLEETNRDAYGLYNPALPTTPFASSLEREHPSEMFVARAHVSNAAATDVAVPLLYTGAKADDPVSVLQTVPLLWDYFSAAGYDTAAYLPFSLKWGLFDVRLSDRPGVLKVNHVFHAGQWGRKLVRDASVEDSDVVADVLAYEGARGWPEPFLQIVSLKMPHAYGVGAIENHLHLVALPPEQESARPYLDAIAYDDGLMEKVLAAIPAAARANTIVAVVSDHGADTRHRRLRIENYYEEANAVPFWLYIPEQVQRGIPAEALATLRAQLAGQVTSHIDVLPTLLDLTGLYREPRFREAIAQLPGRSLLEPGAPAEPMVVLSTGPLRSYDNEGFALLFDAGRTRYVFDMGSEHFFDERVDPGDDHDLIEAKESRAEIERARLFAATDPALARIVARYRFSGAARRPQAAKPLLRVSN